MVPPQREGTLALSSSRRPSPASSPKPVEPTPAPPASTPAGAGGLPDVDEISKLLNALGDAEVADSPSQPPSSPGKFEKPSAPVHFVIPAGPGGATRPLGAILSAPEEKSVSDMDFILPDLKPESGRQSKAPPIVKLAPSSDTVKLSPSSMGPRTGTGAIRLGPSDPAKTASHNIAHLTGNQTDATKTAKHGTVRLTGNQTEAAKTAKHGTVRLTGNQTDAAKTASPMTASATPAEPVVAKDEKPAPKAERPRRKKAAKPRRSNGGQDPWASVVFLLLVILVVLLYVGFFIVRPKIVAARSAAQSAPASAESVKPGRKPMAKPRPTVKVKPSASPASSVDKPKTGTVKPAQTTGKTSAPTVSPAETAARSDGAAAAGAVTDNGLGEVDVPEDDESAEGAAAATPAPSEEPVKPVSKFAPPWARKDTPAKPVEEKPEEEVVIEVPAAVDVPEAREWPELKVTAVIGSGNKGSVLVNGIVVSVGEELEEGPVLKSVSRQAAIFEWDGDRRTIYVSSKSE